MHPEGVAWEPHHGLLELPGHYLHYGFSPHLLPEGSLPLCGLLQLPPHPLYF